VVRIFYSDGSFSTYLYAPKTRGSVQAIVQKNEKGWFVESHGDFYLLREGRWQAADMSGVITELKNRGLVKLSIGTKHKVKVGWRWKIVNEPGFYGYLDLLDWVLIGETVVDSGKFAEIHQTALNHADFARRNGKLPD
jgi:hypothetical protein